MRCLLDTNVLVRAVIRPRSPAREVLVRLRSEPHTLITSPFILTELYRVLHYPRIQAQVDMPDLEVRELVRAVEQVAEIVDDRTTTLELSPDPDDNPILQATVTARADVLCTLDRHFHTADVRSFCSRYGIRLLDDVALLRELRALDG